MRVLVVDDSPAFVEYMVGWLIQNGHYAYRSFNGAGALEKFQIALEVGTPFDLVISDVQMPVMDGLQLLEIVKTLRPETITVLMTGDIFFEGDTSNCDYFETKPVTMSVLIGKITTDSAE